MTAYGKRAAGHLTAGLALGFALVVLLAGCGPRPMEDGPPVQRPQLKRADISLAFQPPSGEQGLAEALKSAFETAYPQFRVQLHVGDEDTLEDMAGKKSADIVVIRSGPEVERLVTAGARAKALFHSDYLIVGPGSDPAKLETGDSGVAALQRIARQKAPFFSASATATIHAAQASRFASASVDTTGATWYHDTGEDAVAALEAASDGGGYAFVDRATWLANAARLPGLVVHVEGSPDLVERYVAVEVPGSARPQASKTFWDWLDGERVRQIISVYGADRYGSQLFFPAPPG